MNAHGIGAHLDRLAGDRDYPAVLHHPHHAVGDLRRLQARDRPPTKTVQVAISRMCADADAARFRQFNRAAHDVGIAGMKAAGDVHRRRQLDHRGVIAHFPCAKTFAEIAIEIDGCHVAGPLLVSGLVGQSGPAMSARVTACQVPASTALTAWPATLASCSASMLRSTLSMARSRSGRVRNNSANLRASIWASAMLTALKRKPRPAGICANRPK